MPNINFTWDDYITGLKDLVPAIANTLPWGVKVADLVNTLIPTLSTAYKINGTVAVHQSAVVETGVILKGPIIVGPGCFIGAHAYLRGGVFLLADNSVGPGCELKSTVLFPRTNLAHFNFIGDSVVGADVNFEAGSIVANHYNEREEKQMNVLINGKIVATGASKFGAVIGDGSRIGANAVLSPGTILGKKTIVGRLELVKQVG
jgi:UDP-N-acetylglucosamine diphosphorylase / glucose-1-phosphate thymidylyltransferase / UDP-N-acetylgalactosamine diphosphorylase / glucosamine-1-phosphate N-acetyltransferase / galactosamine-1-phosphate N-acetyltransferase